MNVFFTFKKLHWFMSMLSIVVLPMILKGQDTYIPDSLFGNFSRVTTLVAPEGTHNHPVFKMQDDGKILSAIVTLNGSNPANLNIVKYEDDGTFDSDWGVNGSVTLQIGNSSQVSAEGMAIQPDGKVLICGYRDTVIAGNFVTNGYILRFTKDGLLDQNFGSSGLLNVNSERYSGFRKIALVGNKIFTFGYRQGPAERTIHVFDINDGEPVISWGDSGEVVYSTATGHYPQDIEVGDQDQIYMSTAVRIHKFLSSGEHDTVFGNQGMVSYNMMSGSMSAINKPEFGDAHRAAFKLDSVGNIYVSGIAYPQSEHSGFGIVQKFDPSGELDISFANQGILPVDFRKGDEDLLNHINDINLLSDGSIIVSGSVKDKNTGELRYAMSKFDNAGNIDLDFGDDGVIIVENFHDNDKEDYCYNVLVSDDNRITLAGHTTMQSLAVGGVPKNSFNLVRYKPLGADDEEDENDTTGIENPSNNSEVNIYPNPVKSELNVEFSGKGKVEIYSMTGEIMDQRVVRDRSIFDVSKYAQGLYVIRFSRENGKVEQMKFVKQ